MKSRIVTRKFGLVGITGKGPFAEFGSIVPDIAREVLSRRGEVGSDAAGEIAVFEPKKSGDHLEGEFCVGLMVECPVQKTPAGMTYLEIEGTYATARGKTENLVKLHSDLQRWLAGNGHRINTAKIL